MDPLPSQIILEKNIRPLDLQPVYVENSYDFYDFSHHGIKDK